MSFIRRSLLPLAAVSMLAMGGCTNTQQDALYHKVVNMGRNVAGFELRTTDVGDVQMSYLERPGNGPVVLLVHGFSANKDTWLRFTADLPEDWHVIAPDLAGHGDTPAPTDGDYGLVHQAERLHALMAKVGASKFHIAGNSMGGAISAIYATLYPEQVASLILIDAAGVDAPHPSDFIKGLADGKNPLIATDEASFENRWNLVMAKPPVLPWPLRPALIRDTIRRAAINREIFADMLATRDTLEANHFEEQLTEKAKMPALILWGEKDQVLDVSMVDVFKQKLPQAQVKIFPGVGHVPMMEIPQETADAVSQFIASAE